MRNFKKIERKRRTIFSRTKLRQNQSIQCGKFIFKIFKVASELVMKKKHIFFLPFFLHLNAFTLTFRLKCTVSQMNAPNHKRSDKKNHQSDKHIHSHTHRCQTMSHVFPVIVVVEQSFTFNQQDCFCVFRTFIGKIPNSMGHNSERLRKQNHSKVKHTHTHT